jgi:prephenate dehydrogenase
VSDSVKQILIIGLGLIGSSIAKASKNKGIIVHGFDINESSLSTALEDNIIDSSFDSIESINHKDLVDKIDLIVISVSPKNTQNILNQIKNLWNTNITITETASVKNHLNISSASNIILSHPIAGSHKSGISSIDENLFQNKKTIVCNPNNVNDIHINKLNNFWKHAMQMRVSEMSVKEHDLLFAMTSHLPHLISYALIDSIRLSSKDVEDNAGGGLKEFIRLSGSNAEMWRDIFELNDKNIIKSLASFQLSINNLLELIAKTKEIPEVFSHSELLEKELDEIKKYKEDTF